MGVDDIVRGRDLLRSTALQMWIRQCLLVGGFEPECGNTEKPLAEHPEYAHLPLIDNAAGRRLASANVRWIWGAFARPQRNP